MPQRYSLIVSLEEISTHMRLLTEAKRNNSIAVHSVQSKDEEGNLIENKYEITIACQDMKCLLSAITMALSGLGQDVIDADIVTTNDGFVLDRFIVKDIPGSGEYYCSLSPKEIRSRIQLEIRKFKTKYLETFGSSISGSTYSSGGDHSSELSDNNSIVEDSDSR